MTGTGSSGWNRREMLRKTGGAVVGVPTALAASGAVRALHGAGLSAQELGALFDGRTDDAPALQRGIDAAARAGRPLALPSGVACLGAPLDLRGRNVALIGDPAGGTILRAAAALPCLLNADETREVIDSPFYIFGLTLDGAGKAVTGLRLRYRHRTVLDTVAIGGCSTGVDEKDSWLGRRINCRMRTNAIGWRLRGANHSSVWTGCSFIDSRLVHLDIGSEGTAKDGNNALLFQGCDIEFGEGHGIAVAAGATATFDTCYLGENIGGDVLRSAGTVLLRGGALFIGHKIDGVGIAMAGGQVTVLGASIRGQRFGSLDRLASARGGGRATFDNVDMQLMLGGNPTLDGDALGTMPMRVFAPIFGCAWHSTATNAVIVEKSVADERSVLCQRVTGPHPLIGLAAPLQDTAAARKTGPGYIVIAYAASRPATLRLANDKAPRAAGFVIGTLPATRGVRTYVKVDVPIAYADFPEIELIMEAGVGDMLTLHHASVSDAGMMDPGPLANLARAR